MGICCPSSKSLYEEETLRALQSCNTREHFTEMYNWPGLIFRRGNPFKIDVPVVGRNASSVNINQITLGLVATGLINLPIIIDNNRVVGDENKWSYKILNSFLFDSKISLEIKSPINSIVGVYKLSISVCNKNIGCSEFILFFNPWDQHDEVYMSNSADLKEYILNDTTKIYMGTEDYVIPKDWDLGQFDPQSIKGAIVLLNMMQPSSRSSAVSVSRQLSALINANDDNGVLVGNWAGKYLDGVNPMSWTGSAEILGQYASTRRPVRYGQCWVFCGVLCTVLRTVGIPARCITNYASLHDTDASLKWEIYLDSDFNPINRGRDSCWNFHCWNEVWLKRMDLDSCHDGWQVVDATPQERSGGLFRVGPASKYAVRNGIIDSPYDVGFVFAEVNADKVFFMLQPNGTFKQYMVKKNELGRMILTKQKFHDGVENITKEYKLETGRNMNELISNDHVSMRNIENTTARNISILICCPSSVSMTDNLNGYVIINGLTNNISSTVKIHALLISYNGRNICKLYEYSETVKPSSKRIDFAIDHDKIQNSVIEEFPYIRIKAYCYDSNNDEMGIAEKTISVKTPDIDIIGVPTACKVDHAVNFIVQITNTLNRPLQHVRLYVKFTDENTTKIKFQDIIQGGKVAHELKVVPRTIGLKKIQVTLECKQCCGFSNVAKFKAEH